MIPGDAEHPRDPRAFIPERTDYARNAAILAEVARAASWSIRDLIETPHTPAQIAQDGPAGSDQGSGTAEGSQDGSGGSLTDLVGLDPDFTGGLDATEYVARQYCGHGPELDELYAANDELGRAVVELRRQVQAVRELHRQRVVQAFDHPITFDDCACCDAAWPCRTIQAIGGEA